jgi:hypothetical protein
MGSKIKHAVILALIGFFVTMYNNTDRDMLCYLYWIDHPYEYRQPINLFGGEMDAGERQDLSYEYRPGKYSVRWSDRNSNWGRTQLFKIDSEVKKVTITPSEVTK